VLIPTCSLLFVLPGLNRQYFPELLPIPHFIEIFGSVTVVEIFGLIGVAIGSVIMVLANRENMYASKGVKIHEGHEVIMTGPYAVIRHPLYLGVFVVILSTPIALGSLISFIPAILVVIMFLVRIRWEETLLLKELTGYKEYTKKVKYKLFPKIY
jgi:protein-S-isoprenylcysteine O-methyltransferase Ste14